MSEDYKNDALLSTIFSALSVNEADSLASTSDFELLGVAPLATPTEIHSAYKRRRELLTRILASANKAQERLACAYQTLCGGAHECKKEKKEEEEERNNRRKERAATADRDARIEEERSASARAGMKSMHEQEEKERQGAREKKEEEEKAPQRAVERVMACTCHYSVLQLKRSATEGEVVKAYRVLARVIHPDKNKTPDALEAMKKCVTANEVLGNTVSRRQYDRELDSAEIKKQRDTQHNSRTEQQQQQRKKQQQQQQQEQETRDWDGFMVFGKHKGWRYSEVPCGYVHWMQREGILERPESRAMRAAFERLGLVDPQYQTPYYQTKCSAITQQGKRCTRNGRPYCTQHERMYGRSSD
jgi:hypothetical protein